MNPRRILAFAAAAAAVVAAAAVTVVAASFAVYALARIWLGPAGGAAVVAAVFALVAIVVAVVATKKARLPKSQPEAEPSVVDRAIQIAKEKPLIAVGAAVVAGVVLMRNPGLVATIVSSFLAGSAAKPEK